MGIGEVSYHWGPIVEANIGQPVTNFGQSGGKTGWPLNQDRPHAYAVRHQWQDQRHALYLVMFGLNDVSTAYRPELSDAQRLALFELNQQTLVSDILECGGIPVLMTNHKLDIAGGRYTADPDRNTKTQQYDDVKREIVARNPDVYLIDLWQRFSDEIDAGNWDFHWAADDLHWNDAVDSSTGDGGHAIAADEITTRLTALGLV